MLESYKLKKAKAKLELESVNKQLAEIKAKKENERWEQMPQWERNIETEILKDKLGLSESKEHSVKYSAIMAGIWTIIIYGGLVLLFNFLSWSMPSAPSTPAYEPTSATSALNFAISNLTNSFAFEISSIIIDIFIIAIIYIESYHIYRRGYGHF